MFVLLIKKRIPMDIKNLLNLISRENRGSFELFYNLYYKQVFRFAYYFLRDKEACRDVVTDVFFSIWQSRKKLKDVINLETYLYITVRNTSTRYLKRNAESLNLPLDELPINFDITSNESPEETLLSKEMEETLKRAIQELPEKCRLIFLMIREEGLKPKQVAEILSIQESTVRVQLKIAIEKIIEAIKPYYPNLTLSTSLIILFQFSTSF